MATRIVQANEGIAEAAKLLRAGNVVAFPTETVYGLGADARSDDAVRGIYAAKGRPMGNPLIVHVAGVEEGKKCAAGWSRTAGELAQRFWPGPLTMVLRRGAGISPLVSAGRETVAIRCPNHPAALALLEAFGGPIAAPSANRSGFTSPTTAGHVMAELSGRIPLILDGGACAIGLESTVVDISGAPLHPPTVLRPGGVTAEMLREALGDVRVMNATVGMGESAASPGMHASHYAPRTAAYRFERAKWPRVERWAVEHEAVALLSHDERMVLGAPHETIRMPAEAGAYAHALYAALRQADERAMRAILVLEPEENGGLWAAVRDRLGRATRRFAG